MTPIELAIEKAVVSDDVTVLYLQIQRESAFVRIEKITNLVR